MRISGRARAGYRLVTYATIGLLYLPLALIFVLSFNSARSLVWPPRGWTTRWWTTFFDVESARAALLSSARIGAVAMVIAVVLGTMLAFALQRHEFFGKHADKANGIAVGDEIRAHVNVNGREHNGRYYTSLSAWKVDVQIGRAHV